MTTDLIAPGTYGVEAIGNLANLLTEELGDDLNIRELITAVKTPSGGGLYFDDPFSTGDDQINELTGIVIGERLRTVTYLESFDKRSADSSSRPDMWSEDGKVQFGVEDFNAKIRALNEADGGNRPYAVADLTVCPYNNYGKALWISENVLTNTYKDLILKVEGKALPVAIVLPWSSIRGWNTFKQGVVASTFMSITASEVTFSLARDKNAGGTDYSKWAFKATGKSISDEEAGQLKEFGKQILATVVAAQTAQGSAAFETPDTVEATGTFGASAPSDLDAAFEAAKGNEPEPVATGAPADLNL